MTANKGFKRRVRARAARTGESYQAAYHRLLAPTEEAASMTEQTTTERRLRVAINVLPVGPGLPTAPDVEAQASLIVGAMADSARAGARLALFSEGALASPHKRLMSRSAPEVDEADWAKLDWPALREQLHRIAAAAREHRIWTFVGAVHELGDGLRPHNSLYVISDRGEPVTRYDKRRLSTTEITHMYTPGTEPVTVDVDGLRIGLVIGLEVLFPDFFTAYADEDADLIVAASHGGGIFEHLVTSYALINQVPVALVIPQLAEDASRPGVYGPSGVIAAADRSDAATMVVAEITGRSGAPTFNYKARHGFYDERLPGDKPRSLSRNAF